MNLSTNKDGSISLRTGYFCCNNRCLSVVGAGRERIGFRSPAHSMILTAQHTAPKNLLPLSVPVGYAPIEPDAFEYYIGYDLFSDIVIWR